MSNIKKNTKNTKKDKLFCGCENKWIRLPNNIIDMLQMQITKICAKNHFMTPYFVHDEGGDYFAPKSICNNECDGKYIYFCTRCKNIIDGH